MSPLKSKLSWCLPTPGQGDWRYRTSSGHSGASTCIVQGAVALVAIGQVAAGGPVAAGPGGTLIDVQLTARALEPGHTVTAEVVGIRALGHTQSAVVAGLGGTALGLGGPAGVAALRSLALGPWRAWVRGTGTPSP